VHNRHLTKLKDLIAVGTQAAEDPSLLAHHLWNRLPGRHRSAARSSPGVIRALA